MTAHPTEAVRRSILDHVTRIAETLDRLDDPRLTKTGRQRLIDNPEGSIRLIWQTEELRTIRPRVVDEARNTIFHLDAVLFDVVPQIQAEMDRSWRAHFPMLQLQARPFLRLGSWVGGDQDGNPEVTADTLREALRMQAAVVLRRYREAVVDLARQYSQSRQWSGAMPGLRRSIAADERSMPRTTARLGEANRDELLRRKLSLVLARLDDTVGTIEGRRSELPLPWGRRVSQ